MSEENNENLQEAVAEPVEAAAAPATTEADAAEAAPSRGRRTEKIGIVMSDKMQKSVVVRVDRYVRRRSKFMAHNELEGVSVGDQVRIIETRPLSARKRWRVVEVLRKASK
jgi:small subunit ribosomal protein S17